MKQKRLQEKVSRHWAHEHCMRSRGCSSPTSQVCPWGSPGMLSTLPLQCWLTSSSCPKGSSLAMSPGCALLSPAQALIGSVRSYVFDVLGQFWATLQAGYVPTLQERAAWGGCYVHTFRACLEAVQLLYA